MPRQDAYRSHRNPLTWNLLDCEAYHLDSPTIGPITPHFEWEQGDEAIG